MKTTIKEKSISFSGPMVRAILEGRKTQSRRPMKPQPDFTGLGTDLQRALYFESLVDSCPYKVGGTLWVQECWQLTGYTGDHQFTIRYPADGEEWASLPIPVEEYQKVFPDTHEGFETVRPSRSMPRWASRITLEITGVRFEKLWDITQDDAKAEGAYYPGPPGSGYRMGFEWIWGSIYGSDSFYANPWVVVIEFKKVEE